MQSDDPSDDTGKVLPFTLGSRMRPMYYKLQGRTAVPCGMDDVGFMKGEQISRIDWTDFECGSYLSTVFLQMDLAFSGRAMLFETMLFKKELETKPRTQFTKNWPEKMLQHSDDWSSRCTTYGEAEAMHAKGLEYAINVLGLKPVSPKKDVG